MVAGKARIFDPLIETLSRDRCRTIDSVEGTEHVEIGPIRSPMETVFVTRKFTDHQGVASAIIYIANFDREDLVQHPVADDSDALKQPIPEFPSMRGVSHSTDVRFIETDACRTNWCTRWRSSPQTSAHPEDRMGTRTVRFGQVRVGLQV